MISILAHRGASARRPENTIEAFLEARRLGADGVELDVRRSRGGALVVHHDALLADGRAVAEVAVPDLPAAVPVLDAALEACAGLLVNVEIKNLPSEPGFDPDESVATEVAALAADGRAPVRILVSSFTLATIDAVHTAEPGVATGWLTLSKFDQLAALATAAERGHSALHPHHSVVPRQLVEAAHAAGLALNTWTVDAPEDLTRMAGFGVDAIITNVPDVARSVLAAGGAGAAG